MLRDMHFSQFTPEFLGQLPRGAFLSVQNAGEVNTMTIGWGFIGYIWQRPALLVAVRPSRYTYNLLETAREFTISVPAAGEFRKSLALAGSRSGRDVDKFSELKLVAQPGKMLSSPVIAGCQLHYECRVLYRQALNQDELPPDLTEKFYPQGDFHVLYFGEILASYYDESAADESTSF